MEDYGEEDARDYDAINSSLLMLDHTEGHGYGDIKYPALSSTNPSSPHSEDGYFKSQDGDHYIHKVKIFDTLGSISLMYDINKDLI